MRNKYFEKYISATTEYSQYNYLNHGTTNEAITEFESRYSIKLPKRYREFLMINNGGELFRSVTGTILDGLSVNQTYQVGIPYLEYNFDKSKIPDELPPSLFVVAECNDGDLICLDLSSSDGNDCRVVLWYLDIGDIELEWDTIGDWLSYEVQCGIDGLD